MSNPGEEVPVQFAANPGEEAAPRQAGLLPQTELSRHDRVCLLIPEVRVYVEMELQEKTSSAEIFTKARQTESAMASKCNKQIGALTAMEKPPDAGASYIWDQIRSTDDHQVAAMKVSANKKKPVRRSKTRVIPGGPMIPPAQRSRPVFCYRCRQWGVHYSPECKISMEEVNRMTPQSRESRPSSAPYDPQYPSAAQ